MPATIATGTITNTARSAFAVTERPPSSAAPTGFAIGQSGRWKSA
jgi:hypothetical protein